MASLCDSEEVLCFPDYKASKGAGRLRLGMELQNIGTQDYFPLLPWGSDARHFPEKLATLLEAP